MQSICESDKKNLSSATKVLLTVVSTVAWLAANFGTGKGGFGESNRRPYATGGIHFTGAKVGGKGVISGQTLVWKFWIWMSYVACLFSEDVDFYFLHGKSATWWIRGPAVKYRQLGNPRTGHGGLYSWENDRTLNYIWTFPANHVWLPESSVILRYCKLVCAHINIYI